MRGAAVGDELLRAVGRARGFRASSCADAPGEAAQGVLGGLERLVQARPGRDAGGGRERLGPSGCGRGGARCAALGRGDDQVVELLEGGGARFQRRRLCATRSWRIASTIPLVCFGDRGRGAGERGARGELGVDRVALAAPLAGVRVRLVDLEDLIPSAAARAPGRPRRRRSTRHRSASISPCVAQPADQPRVAGQRSVGNAAAPSSLPLQVEHARRGARRCARRRRRRRAL